jgi:hypothetical protein
VLCTIHKTSPYNPTSASGTTTTSSPGTSLVEHSPPQLPQHHGHSTCFTQSRNGNPQPAAAAYAYHFRVTAPSDTTPCLSTGHTNSASLATSKPTAPPTAPNHAASPTTRRRRRRPAQGRAHQHSVPPRTNGHSPSQRRRAPSSTSPPPTTSAERSKTALLRHHGWLVPSSRHRPRTPASAPSEAHRAPVSTPPSSPKRQQGNFEHTPDPSIRSDSNEGGHTKRPASTVRRNRHFPSALTKQLYPPHLNSITGSFIERHHIYTTQPQSLLFLPFVVTKKGHTPEHSIIKSLVTMGRTSDFYLGEAYYQDSYWVRGERYRVPNIGYIFGAFCFLLVCVWCFAKHLHLVGPEAMGFTDWQGRLSSGLDMELAPAACVCSEKFVWDLMIVP